MTQNTSTTSKGPDSDTTTHDIRVQAAARYLVDESDPDTQHYLYSYRIVISNLGSRRVRLRSRHWIIRDAFNGVEEVRGEGVVGAFPSLQPGESYDYQSCCPLRTRWGTMEGSYQFFTETGVALTVAIGRFFLVPPPDAV